MASSDGPAQRHRDLGGGFTRLVLGARDWDAPSPVEGWRARDVVGHLVEWLPPLLAGGAGIELDAGDAAGRIGTDPAGAWLAHAAAVQALLDDPATAGRTLSNPHLGTLPVGEAIDRFYTTDVFLHTWDLARATGQDDRLDPQLCADLLAGMEPMDEMLRASGQYGPRVPVPPDAPPQDRLIGFIGRDPAWAVAPTA
jgi:uncharacterized protein (TIGR03086 family)